MSLSERLQHAWSAFRGRDYDRWSRSDWFGATSSYRPDRPLSRPSNVKTVITPIYNRIAIDAASITIRHVRLDENGRYKAIISSNLNDCLTRKANKDQTGRAFIQDVVWTLCEEGSAAIVPVELPKEPSICPLAEVTSLRCGKVVQWAPDSVQVNLYNDKTGNREDIWIPKEYCAIPENPLYAVMNEYNSTVHRIVSKLNLLDKVDNQIGANKLDIIIQLPYTIRSELRREQAAKRLKDIEMQLTGSKFGVAYIGAEEHVTQLNRPIENNLLEQVKYYTEQLFSELGMDKSVFDGTADEKTMLNYHNRTIEPILSAIVDAIDVKFITKTAKTQGQAIKFFRDPFRLVPVSQIAEIADKFTRNEILSPNEVRAIIGYIPVDDPRANQLRNPNINQDQNQTPITTDPNQQSTENGVDETINNTVFK